MREKLAGFSRESATTHPLFQAAVFILAGLAIFYAVWRLPYYGDYENFFYKAARTPLDPYRVKDFFNAPWLAWMLWPLSFLPVHLSGAIWVTVSIMVSGSCIRQLGGSWLAVTLALISPPAIRLITAGEVDAVPLLGLTMLLTLEQPDLKGLGLVLLGTKPQVLAAGALVHWLHLDRRQKWRVLIVPAVVLLLSLLLNGFWLLQIRFELANQGVNLSVWPYGILLGLALVAWSAWKNRPKIGALTTYFLVPYISHSSVFAYLGVFLTLAPRWLMVLVFVAFWVLTIYTL